MLIIFLPGFPQAGTLPQVSLHHKTICRGDFFKGIYPVHRLNLGDDRALELVPQTRLTSKHVNRDRTRSGHEVNAVLNAEHDVFLVLLAYCWKPLYPGSGDGDLLPV